MNNTPNKIRRYSIRRLSIGVVSALTGIFIFGAAPVVSAQDIQVVDTPVKDGLYSMEQTLPELQLDSADSSSLTSDSSASQV